MANKKFSHITIIGPGKVGTAFAAVFRKNGSEIDCIIGRRKLQTNRLARAVRAAQWSLRPEDIPPSTKLLILTLPGDVIPHIALELAQLSHLRWNQITVFHTSGAHPAALLQPLREKGAKIAVIHPIQTFPPSTKIQNAESLFENISFGIDAPPGSIRIAKEIVRYFGGAPLIVPPHMMPLYHAMCVFASGYAVQLLDIIEQCRLLLPGKDRRHKALSPLLFRSIENAMRTSPSKALTGPILRGDVSTISLHLDALTHYMPHAVRIYKAMGLLTVQTAFETGRIDATIKEEFERLFNINGK